LGKAVTPDKRKLGRHCDAKRGTHGNLNCQMTGVEALKNRLKLPRRERRVISTRTQKKVGK